MTKYAVDQNRDGDLVLLNRRDGTLVGFVTGVITQSRFYSTSSFEQNYIRGAQIYASNQGGLHAYGTHTQKREDVPDVENQLVTSPIRSIAIIPPMSGELFEVQADDVAASPSLRLESTYGPVSINGDYAATIFGDQQAIDAEARRLLHLHDKGINAEIGQIRPRDMLIPAGNMLV